jgi:Putative Actinobacterial Holin-X, holin superfamily III
LPAENENLTSALTEVSERMTLLVREEIELAKVEVTQKGKSLAGGALAGVIGAVIGVFALIFVFEAIAWALNSVFVSGAGDLWVGFTIVAVALILIMVIAFLVAWRKFKVGPPIPDQAIEEAKKIRETVTPGGYS